MISPKSKFSGALLSDPRALSPAGVPVDAAPLPTAPAPPAPPPRARAMSMFPPVTPPPPPKPAAPLLPKHEYTTVLRDLVIAQRHMLDMQHGATAVRKGGEGRVEMRAAALQKVLARLAYIPPPARAAPMATKGHQRVAPPLDPPVCASTSPPPPPPVARSAAASPTSAPGSPTATSPAPPASPPGYRTTKPVVTEDDDDARVLAWLAARDLARDTFRAGRVVHVAATDAAWQRRRDLHARMVAVARVNRGKGREVAGEVLAESGAGRRARFAPRDVVEEREVREAKGKLGTESRIDVLAAKYSVRHTLVPRTTTGLQLLATPNSTDAVTESHAAPSGDWNLWTPARRRARLLAQTTTSPTSPSITATALPGHGVLGWEPLAPRAAFDGRAVREGVGEEEEDNRGGEMAGGKGEDEDEGDEDWGEDEDEEDEDEEDGEDEDGSSDTGGDYDVGDSGRGSAAETIASTE
ncbi:hypothetical protein GGF32_003557 [Allomyces javanicus]|nr:hypothetical protein GGF32_003557 [Allomyces javanicus]